MGLGPHDQQPPAERDAPRALVEHIAADGVEDQVRAAALDLAREIAESSPLGVVETRATMRRGMADSVRAATDRELAEQTRLRATEDFAEGIKAMGERRVPNFAAR